MNNPTLRYILKVTDFHLVVPVLTLAPKVYTDIMAEVVKNPVGAMMHVKRISMISHLIPTGSPGKFISTLFEVII